MVNHQPKSKTRRTMLNLFVTVILLLSFSTMALAEETPVFSPGQAMQELKAKGLSKTELRKAMSEAKAKWKASLTQKQKAKLREREVKDRLLIKGKSLKFDVPPVIKEGRTLIPVRAISEGLGATVKWDAATKTITITRGDVTVIMVLGEQKMTVNSTVVILDVPAGLISNRTFVPIRFIAVALGEKVKYDPDTGDIDIGEDDEDAIKLAAPVKPALAAGIATWQAVYLENDGYTLQLFKDGAAAGATVTVAHGAALSYSFASAMTTPGSYTVTVKALGKDAFRDSDASVPSEPQVVAVKLATPAKPALAAGTATWQAVYQENNGYSLQLFKDGVSAGTAVIVAHGAALSYNFAPIMTAAGSYTVAVKALGTGTYSDSDASVPSDPQVVATKLATPAKPALVAGTATWQAVYQENNGYSLQLFKDGVAAGTAVTVAHGAALSYNFAPVMTAAGSYTVAVKALGTGTYSDSDASVPSEPQVVTAKLATPAQPSLAAGIATWTAVANENNGYSVQLYKDGVAALAPALIAHGQTLNYNFSAAMTAAGNYTVTVKALGAGVYTDSDPSVPSDPQVVAAN